MPLHALCFNLTIYRFNGNVQYKVGIYWPPVPPLYLSRFFGYLYFTTYISVYFDLATFCKENGYFYYDTFPLKPSLLVTKSKHL